jgi:hypothetical protein
MRFTQPLGGKGLSSLFTCTVYFHIEFPAREMYVSVVLHCIVYV